MHTDQQTIYVGRDPTLQIEFTTELLRSTGNKTVVAYMCAHMESVDEVSLCPIHIRTTCLYNEMPTQAYQSQACP